MKAPKSNARYIHPCLQPLFINEEEEEHAGRNLKQICNIVCTGVYVKVNFDKSPQETTPDIFNPSYKPLLIAEEVDGAVVEGNM